MGALFVQPPSYRRVFSIQIFDGHTFDMINVIQLLKVAFYLAEFSSSILYYKMNDANKELTPNTRNIWIKGYVTDLAT